MPSTPYAGRTRFGLLPEPESNPASFLTSLVINGVILTLLIVFGTVVHHDIVTRKMEQTEIVFPTTPPPEIKIKVKIPPTPKVPPAPEVPKVAIKLDQPKINVPKVEPKPEIKPLPQMKEALPNIPAAKPQTVNLAPQPKVALAQAAAPALAPQQKPVVAQTHFGDLNGVTPNPNATKAATVAAIGNPYGGNQGPAAAPRGVVGSTGIGNGIKSGSNAGAQGKVAAAGIVGGNGTANTGGNSGPTGHVGSAGIPGLATTTGNSSTPAAATEPKTTPPVLLSSSKPAYTPEATQLKIQGDVVLRVTITTSGQVVVRGVIHGLGHGLDESAVRTAPTYKFRPATQNGQPVDFTTNIIIKFQTA
jgi:TonB family protein